MDEVGRGAWAGPIVVGAVSINSSWQGDSKSVPKSERAKAANQIYERAKFASLGWADAWEIDDLGLSAALELAYRRAVKTLPKIDEIIIDGNVNYLANHAFSRCVIKADETIGCVGAASVIAKVARDEYMAQLGRVFPDYGFERHVGYGTKKHIEGIKRHGLCRHHRRSYKPIAAHI